MTKEQIALMVSGTKEIKDWMGQKAWLVPSGQCTNSFTYAVQLWADFFITQGFYN